MKTFRVDIGDRLTYSQPSIGNYLMMPVQNILLKLQ